MKDNYLEQAEIFVILAFVFVLVAADITSQFQENPPIITLSEADEAFKFSTASDQLTPTFLKKLEEEIIPKVDSLSKHYNCDAIQFIGHTSGTPTRRADSSGRRSSNLDYKLTNAIYNPQVSLVQGSNVDLGMMRAVAIMRVFLQNKDSQGMLDKIKYMHPYSAGQVITVDGMLLPMSDISKDQKLEIDARRRIEIRLFKYKREDPLATGSRG